MIKKKRAKGHPNSLSRKQLNLRMKTFSVFFLLTASKNSHHGTVLEKNIYNHLHGFSGSFPANIPSRKFSFCWRFSDLLSVSMPGLDVHRSGGLLGLKDSLPAPFTLRLQLLFYRLRRPIYLSRAPLCSRAHPQVAQRAALVPRRGLITSGQTPLLSESENTSG